MSAICEDRLGATGGKQSSAWERRWAPGQATRSLMSDGEGPQAGWCASASADVTAERDF